MTYSAIKSHCEIFEIPLHIKYRDECFAGWNKHGLVTLPRRSLSLDPQNEVQKPV